MSATTGIQWTDATWNAITGCKQVSPGCANCYAKVEHDRRHKASLAGKRVAPQYAEPFEVVQFHPDRLDAPLRRRKPARYFVTSGADPFHEDVPDEFIDQMFAVMALAEWHAFQLLTKRPARMLAYMTERWKPATTPPQSKGDDREARVHRAIETLVYDTPGRRFGADRWWTPDGKLRAKNRPWPLSNVWLGVSVENQRWADERIPLLMETPAAVRFLSCEPLLGPLELDFDDIAWRDAEGRYIDWVIVGGESGSRARPARPCNVHSLTDVVAQCDFAGVPCFVKQMGSRPWTPDLTGWRCGRELLPDASGYALQLRDSHGGDPDEWPGELRVREFPTQEVRA